MFDIKSIRNDPAAFDAGMARRGLGPQSGEVLSLDEAHRATVTEAQELQTRRNEASREIGQIKSQGGDAEAAIAQVAELKRGLKELEVQERDLGAQLNTALMASPNIPLESVPDGGDEDDNVTVREVGNPKSFEFEAQEHWALGEALGLMDFERAANMSGARFVVLRGALARLERALGQFMLDLHTGEHGYEEMVTPVLVRSEALEGTGQLPKFAEDLFKTTAGHWLIPTAEVTLTNLERGNILDADSLPRRYAALTQCFRAEAGSAGKDTRGMIRQHQFAKVEMVSITTPEASLDELERMTGAAEDVLKSLGLAYRVIELCTGDMGFAAEKTYDLEVWLPGQRRYREISSCSVCGEFQARRMGMRFRPGDTRDTRFPHTLNGSGVAVGRALVAVMENYQNADGSITVPEALRSYMGGVERISD